MKIWLGNLTVRELEKRLGIELTDQERNFLEETHWIKANHIPKGKWHCFDMPFTMMCGDMEIALKIRDIFEPYADEMQEPLRLALAKKNNE